MKAQNLNGLAAQFVDMKEKKYASNIREPLGMSYSRQYQWPDKVANNDIAFGVKLDIIPDQAKMAIYPTGGSLEEKVDVARMYQKTHGNWGPGEQKKRDYVWDQKLGEVSCHAFGYGEKRLLNGAARAIMPERIEESFPKTVIVKKIVED